MGYGPFHVRMPRLTMEAWDGAAGWLGLRAAGLGSGDWFARRQRSAGLRCAPGAVAENALASWRRC